MILKWIFNSLLFLWIYHAVVRPLFLGYFYGKPKEKENDAYASHHKPAPRKKQDDEGEYVDYEEIK